jgi:UPF0755 protein
MKRTLTVFLVLIGVIVVAMGGVAVLCYQQIKNKAWLPQEAWIYVRSDDTVDAVLQQLEEAGGAVDAWNFTTASRLFGLDDALKRGVAGAYHLKQGMSAGEVVRKVTHHQQDPVSLTFIGTRTLPELAGKMSHQLEADSLSILQAMYDEEFLAEVQLDKANVSAIFLPDTYQTYWNVSPKRLMQRLWSEYKKFWNEERQQACAALKLTPLQAVILCSIAEEETADRQERGVVARLYWNRLQRGMPLQADPTVKYAVGDFQLRRILNKHLKVQSPYNTYLHAGLPPGPIRVVEKATIEALLRSKPHKYLYMCAKEDFSGLHNFATTIREHNKNAARYHKALRDNHIR